MEDQISAANMLVLRELLPVPCDVNGRVSRDHVRGPSALWLAARRGLLEVVVILHRLGASPTLAIPDNGGITPLGGAAASGCLAVVQWLAGHGGSVTQPTNDGNTPLYGAPGASPSTLRRLDDL